MRCGECLYWDDKRRRGDRAPCLGVGPKLKASNDPMESSIGHWPRTLVDERCRLFKPLPPATGVQVMSVTVVD